MDFKKFEEMVKIDFIESSNCYGHHPMQLAAINKKGELELNVLLHFKLNDIKSRVDFCMNRDDFKELFISLDFPSNDELENDFILLLHLQERTLKESIIKEYDRDTGEIINISSNDNYKIVNHIVNLFIGEK